MRWEQQVQYASISDIGFRRQNNQDSLIVQICSDQDVWSKHGHLFLVADGMGGHAVGELASKIAVDTIPHTFFKTRDQKVPDALKNSIEVANGAIYNQGMMNRDFERMGTTCTALVLSPEGAIVGHVGDSRVYRIRDGRIDQLSFDHSLQWELIRQGRMDPEEVFLHEPRNVITRSLGPEEEVQVDIEGPYPVFPGDVYLLCSDGLTGHLEDSEIGMIANELSPGEACRLLVNLANLRGGSDNISVVVAKVGELPGGVTHVPRENRSEDSGGISRSWLAGFWLVAITFVGGLSLTLLGRSSVGWGLIAVSLIAFAAMLFRLWKNHPRAFLGDSGSQETALWSPYRTVSARFSRKFLNHLAAVESELQRAAGEEGWPIDRATHEKVYRNAKQAVVEDDYSLALAEYAKAIDVLMVGVQIQRKQMRQELQRGRSSNGKNGLNEKQENSKPPVEQ